MDHIHKLDTALNELFRDFDQIAGSIPFTPIGNLLNDALVEKQEYPGVYFIEVNTANTSLQTVEQWINQFCIEWLDEQYIKQFVANPRKKRMKVHLQRDQLDDWMPLYIGKSKHIDRRLWEHVHLELSKKTFALKLKARPTMMSRDWRFSTINLSGVQNYDVLAPKIENAMRRKYHPIVGKQ